MRHQTILAFWLRHLPDCSKARRRVSKCLIVAFRESSASERRKLAFELGRGKKSECPAISTPHFISSLIHCGSGYSAYVIESSEVVERNPDMEVELLAIHRDICISEYQRPGEVPTPPG
jgi:hypothetical protein